MRRSLVVEEANSIGTTWLRAGLLPAPQRQEVRDLLKRYTRVKLEEGMGSSGRNGIDPARRSQVDIRFAMV